MTSITAARYAAFISYSHKDAAAARALHRRLESYRIPRRLAGGAGAHGPVPARLTPIFRDRDELPAAGDLSETVRAALATSGGLIVICSPNAAASQWVAREIEAFRELNPDRPVLAAIIDGDPAECFPSALTVAGTEPLAADLRRSKDGRRLGFLKLVAGLTGIGLDALVQRDAARQLRRVTAVTLVAVATAVVMAVLMIVALNARREADRQRAEAESLVEFMLTDLRDKLDGEVRLKVLTEVNARALEHYAGQDLTHLAPDALARRARILHAMGEDDGKRGKRDRALAMFQEAYRTTEALLRTDPVNPDRIFVHAQSEYWIGYNAFERSNYAAARQSWQRYADLADRLVAIDARKPEWRMEVGYAQGNLCTIALQPPVDTQSAIDSCLASLDSIERATKGSVKPGDLRSVANRHGWLADAYRAAGRLKDTLHERERQLVIAERLLAQDPKNAKLRASRLWAVRGVAITEMLLGRNDAAREKLRFVVKELGQLIAFDPENAEWRVELNKAQEELSHLSRAGAI